MARILAELLLPLLWFSLLITTFGQDTTSQECDYPYYVMNTYRSAQNPISIRFSCYSETSTCKIVHEKGNTGEVEPVIELAPGSIEELLLEPFLGDVFRSSGQFDATLIEDNEGELEIRFPRGTDAGTLFAPSYSFPKTQTQDVFESCSIATLQSSSDVILYLNDVESRRISLGIGSITRISISVFASESKSVRLVATNPVIVSCFSFLKITESAFYTWKPISSEPIFAYLDNGQVTITPTNCSTGEYIDNFESAMTIEYGELSDGSCTQSNPDTLPYSILISGKRCGVRAMAEENGICLSMLAQQRSPLLSIEMGWITSTSSTKITTIPSDSPILAITKSTATCQYENDSNRVNLACEDNFEGSLSSTLCSSQTPVLTGEGYLTVECSAPAFFYSTGTRKFTLQNMGLQNLLVWEQVFKREECYPPMPNPQPPTNPSSAMERASKSLCLTLLPLIALLSHF